MSIKKEQNLLWNNVPVKPPPFLISVQKGRLREAKPLFLYLPLSFKGEGDLRG
jgi:hypothetical protein